MMKMNKKLVVVGITILLISVGLSGCTEEAKDTDGDGYDDDVDVYPDDPSEWKDSDNDGIGDNADAFPYDSTETKDSDNDGTGDNSDDCPTDPNEQYDRDKDGVGDNSDAFPYDSTQTVDRDGDGYGDNPNGNDADAFPDNPSEWLDSDNDGIGNNVDAFPYDSTQWTDRDGDGYGDNPDGNNPDIFPDNPNLWRDRTNTILTQKGIDYICNKFDDGSFCCVKAGISWSYVDIEGTVHYETGGTADVVQRLILVGSVNTTDPRNEKITYEIFKSVNEGNDISLQDADTIRQHDEPSEDQWCIDIDNHGFSQNQINLICQYFGDNNLCCVRNGLMFGWTDDHGETETGIKSGTASIVGFLFLGLLESFTMEYPARGTYNRDEINIIIESMNINLATSIYVTYHDEPFEDQWCYSGYSDTKLTLDGIDYVCQKYGDSNLCVVSINAGLLFDYTDPDGHSYSNVPGATSDIVWMIVMGMVTKITMVNPSRSTIIDPLTELETVNGGSVTPTDANGLDDHDEASAYQWCYSGYGDTKLTLDGIDYICQNFGDTNECCVLSGLQWEWTDIDGNNGIENGGTGAAVGTLLLHQLIVKITMLNPPRGDFTYQQLRTANDGNDLTFADVDQILLNDGDPPGENQWCYSG